MYTDTDLSDMTDAKRFLLLKERMNVEKFEKLPTVAQKEIILKTLR